MAIKPFIQQQRTHTIAPHQRILHQKKNNDSTNFVGVLRVGASQNHRFLFDYIHFYQAASTWSLRCRFFMPCDYDLTKLLTFLNKTKKNKLLGLTDSLVKQS